MKKFKVEIDGKVYRNPKDVEKLTQISKNTLIARWYRGIHDAERLLAKPKKTQRGGKRISIPYQGKQYTSLGSLADDAGLSRQLVYTRYNRGKRIETGLLAPKTVRAVSRIKKADKEEQPETVN